jgi:hypothetical protein
MFSRLLFMHVSFSLFSFSFMVYFILRLCKKLTMSIEVLGFCCLPKRFFNFDVFGWDCFERPPGYLDICLWSCILVIYASRIILLTVPISIQNFLSSSFYFVYSGFLIHVSTSALTKGTTCFLFFF